MVRSIVPLACVLVLGACSGDVKDDATDGQPRQETALEGLSPERFCDLLSNDAVEQALNVVIKDAKGRQSGRPPILHKYCQYSVDFKLEDVDTVPPIVGTGVNQTRDKDVQEILDDAFTDIGAEPERVSDYERVDGLGKGAGYGDEPAIGGDLNQSKLVVVFTAGEERFALEVHASPQTPLDQLKPLASDLLAALEDELR